MSASKAEILGFLEQLIQLMRDNKLDLKDKGFDITNWVTNLESLGDAAVAKNAERDAMQAALTLKNKEVQAAETIAYETGSTILDAVIGVLGKKTPLAKQAAKLRSNINKQSKKKTAKTAKTNDSDSSDDDK